MRTLVWFRGKDLRLHDHAPLIEGARGELIPLFVLDPWCFAPQQARALPNRLRVLLASLAELAEGLAARGSRLLLVEGRSAEVVPALARRFRVDQVLAHRWCEPFARERDTRVACGLDGIPFRLFEGECLAPPGSVRTAQGAMFSVFTPFARAFAREVQPSAPLPAPAALPPLPADVQVPACGLPDPASLGLDLRASLLPAGERAARARLAAFLDRGLGAYAATRDRLDGTTSRLSQDLHFGLLSVRELWARTGDRDAERFRSELLWREFAHHLLFEHPGLLERPFRPAWEAFPWREDEEPWQAWCEGRTGYPVVDAAARQLLAEGFVHNRARMIAASFLTKHLMQDYRRGEAHYLHWLADGDWASNNLGWQWSAGCGVDAQPWFRIFHPVTQGLRHDPEGAYVRRHVPELAGLDARWIHRPWEAPADALRKAGVVLGETYPRPIVDHARARERFLAAARGL